MSLGQNDRDKWINLSALHEKEIYDLQGKVADLVRLQLETLEERNKAEAENERLRKAGDAMADCINEFRRGILCNALDKVGGFRVWLNWKKAQSDLPQEEGETK